MNLMEYKLRLLQWSATDYAYLINNQLGWISDDEKWYIFTSEEDKEKFIKYLDNFYREPK